MTENIDTLMDLDPLKLTSDNVESIILYYRRQRATQASGGPKPKKETGPKLSAQDLGLVPAAPKLQLRRL